MAKEELTILRCRTMANILTACADERATNASIDQVAFDTEENLIQIHVNDGGRAVVLTLRPISINPVN